MTHHTVENLWGEVTYLAYHLHWDLGTVLDLEHGDRVRVMNEIASLNERAWEGVRSIG
jgi:hypothetical protein